MGDTTNWEFAAAVAAVSIGLGGLLLFTIIGAIGSWRVFDRARLAALESAKASIAVQELARSVSARDDAATAPHVASRAGAGVPRLLGSPTPANALIEQQGRLQEAVRNLVESGLLRADDSGAQLREIEGAIKRLEQHVSQIASAVANLSIQR